VKKLASGINSDDVHAEEAAIRNLSRRRQTRHRFWSKRKKFVVDILVIRLNKNGSLGSSKPCVRCIRRLMASYKVTIRNVYYSITGGNIVKKKFHELIAECTEGRAHVTRGRYSYARNNYDTAH
jgi:hypothetical protein